MKINEEVGNVSLWSEYMANSTLFFLLICLLFFLLAMPLFALSTVYGHRARFPRGDNYQVLERKRGSQVRCQDEGRHGAPAGLRTGMMKQQTPLQSIKKRIGGRGGWMARRASDWYPDVFFMHHLACGVTSACCPAREQPYRSSFCF